jgi:hypothetical protein
MRSRLSWSFLAPLQAGVEAHERAQYGESIAHFQKATELAAEPQMAKLYLVSAWVKNIAP